MLEIFEMPKSKGKKETSYKEVKWFMKKNKVKERGKIGRKGGGEREKEEIEILNIFSSFPNYRQSSIVSYVKITCYKYQ